MTNDSKFFIIKNFAQSGSSIVAVGYFLYRPIAVYTNPIESISLNVCKFSINNNDKIETIYINNTIKKCAAFILDNYYFVMPLLH